MSSPLHILDPLAKHITPFIFENPQCHDDIFQDFDLTSFFALSCHNQLISKALGYAIIGGSMMVKVPQILKMMNNNSSEGISSTSTLLDLFMTFTTLAYGFTKNLPFASYGDTLFVFLQTAVILVLIPWYKKNMPLFLVYVAISVFASYATYVKMFGLDLITLFQQAQVPLVVISRGIQILTNFGNKSTGQLSGITYFLSFAGCASRVFTSLVDAKDNLMALTFGTATLLNGLVWFQILYYGGAASKDDKKKKQ